MQEPNKEHLISVEVGTVVKARYLFQKDLCVGSLANVLSGFLKSLNFSLTPQTQSAHLKFNTAVLRSMKLPQPGFLTKFGHGVITRIHSVKCNLPAFQLMEFGRRVKTIQIKQNQTREKKKNYQENAHVRGFFSLSLHKGQTNRLKWHFK